MNVNIDKGIMHESYANSHGEVEWFIKEDDVKYFPFVWDLFFATGELSFARVLEVESPDGEESNATKDIKDSSIIFGSMHSVAFNDREDAKNGPTYSMFGTDRLINKFSIRIIPSKNGDEYLKVTASPSFSVENSGFFEETFEDFVEFNLFLNNDRWEAVANLLESQKINSVQLRLGGASGFYSKWTPTISANSIKILTKRHDVESVSGQVHNLSRAGNVDEFSIEFIRNAKSKTNSKLTDNDFSGCKNSSINKNPNSSNTEDEAKSSINRLLRSLYKSSLIIVILLFLILMK